MFNTQHYSHVSLKITKLCVRLCETVVSHGIVSPELSDKVFSKILKGREVDLCCHPSGNFIFQRLLDHIPDKEAFVGLVETVGIKKSAGQTFI